MEKGTKRGIHCCEGSDTKQQSTDFDVVLPTVVTTDASNYGLSVVLQQVHPEGIRTVSFAS